MRLPAGNRRDAQSCLTRWFGLPRWRCVAYTNRMGRLAALLVIALSACATTSNDGKPQGPTREQLAAQLTQIDRQMSQLSARSGMGAAFAAMFDADAVTFRNNAPLHGRDAAVAETMRCGQSCQLIWEPVHAEADSALGYTWGTYTWTKMAGGETEQRATGNYVTIWRRNDQGEWKAVLDIGTGGD